MVSENIKGLAYAGGIFGCYFFYGLVQETITKAEYVGENGENEKFTYTATLVFIQCIINALFASMAKRVLYKEHIDTTSHKLYAACAITYLGAMVASNRALQWVAYPTQVLGKSAKPIPVMILGVLLAHKRYPLQKYLFVLCITLGVAMFVYKDSKGGIGADQPIGMGELLLVVSLTLDGLTGVTQSRMRSGYNTQSCDMMLFMNVYSILYLGIYLITGEAYQFYSFAHRNPVVISRMLLFGFTSALGQHFIFLIVANFGPLTCSIVTTTRKFFTLLASIIIFQHPISTRQCVATGLVFLGLGLDTMYGKEIKTNTVLKSVDKLEKKGMGEHSE